jgi:hypothetical protein
LGKKKKEKNKNKKKKEEEKRKNMWRMEKKKYAVEITVLSPRVLKYYNRTKQS